MGLFHGRIKEKENYSDYFHGILTGKRKSDCSMEEFSDGVLHGKQEAKGNIKYFYKGLESKEETIPLKPIKKKIRFGKEPEKNYTGELYFRPVFDRLVPRYLRKSSLEVRGYKNGILTNVKYYLESGEKIGEYIVYKGDINRVLKYSRYIGGRLSYTFNYNSEGIVHGEVIEISPDDDVIIRKGIYNLGVFSGEVEGVYYLNGIEVDPSQKRNIFSLIISEFLKSEEQLDFRKHKEGKDYTFIDYYDKGRLIKSYKFCMNILEMIIIPLKDGGYIEERYSNGILMTRFNYDSNGIKDGEFLRIEHQGSRTTGNMVKGKVNGKSLHYHGKEIYYVDRYVNGSSYERIVYYDYDRNKIAGRGRGVYSSSLKSWIKIGKAYEYYKGGAVKIEKNYGESITFKKKLNI